MSYGGPETEADYDEYDGRGYDVAEPLTHADRSVFSGGANLCGRKRRYPSATGARRAHAKAHWRVRPYQCTRCHGWHVTNNEKLEGRSRWI